MALNLTKGEKINLKKNGDVKIKTICVGLNWGAIQRKGIFGSRIEPVDLDASIAIYDVSNTLIDVVYFGKLRSNDGAIIHSGDDRTGDVDGDDGLDNEVITIDLEKVNLSADKLIVILNSFQGHDFAIIPFATMRLYEGTPSKVKSIFATYNIASEPSFAGHVSMILGKIYRHKGEWKVEAIGEPTRDKTLEQTARTAIRYL